MAERTLCEEKHSRVDEKLEQHDKDIERLDNDMDIMKQSAARRDVIVETVCKKIDALITVLIGSLLSAFGGAIAFIVWYIQNIR